jgi:serine/threonine protein kinase
LRQSGITVDFRRIFRVGYGFYNLADYQLNLSAFKKKSVLDTFNQILSQRYVRCEDGSLFVVKSIDRSKSVARNAIEIENLLNLCHPCIAPPIGFGFPVQSSESQKLKILRFYAEGNSLAEVISINPVWWTATVKAKAIAGIVLGLRFAHSLGLVHGRLNSSNIFFDLDHRIQLVDFCPMDLRIGENDTAPGIGGFSGQGWSPQTDVHGFASILLEIIVDHSTTVLSVSNEKATVHLDIPVFVSEIIAADRRPELRIRHSFNDIYDILKKHDFEIVPEVDSAEVWAFVHWVELLE